MKVAVINGEEKIRKQTLKELVKALMRFDEIHQHERPYSVKIITKQE